MRLSLSSEYCESDVAPSLSWIVVRSVRLPRGWRSGDGSRSGPKLSRACRLVLALLLASSCMRAVRVS